MSPRRAAARRARWRGKVGLVALVLGWTFAALFAPRPSVAANAAVMPASSAGLAQHRPERLIARVIVNTVSKGDADLLLDPSGSLLAPVRECQRWGLKLDGVAHVQVDGEDYVWLELIPDVDVKFDQKSVTVELTAGAQRLPNTAIDLRWERRPDVRFPADDSIFLNYSLSGLGNPQLGERQYQAATQLAARTGNWLLSNTTSFQQGFTVENEITRFLTSLQYDDRPNLRRATIGDFFTPGLETTSGIPMGGLSFAKVYQMDPYLVPYPTAGFTTQITLPSTVDVRIDGNLVAQRQVQPGPLDITSITGSAGQRNVTVTVRDPFGREQILGQPFYFSQFGLAKGLQEYSYNLGFLRQQYGVASNDYGPLAAAAFHRVAFTDTLTLGLRGEATSRLGNLGPFATVLLPHLGILGLGVSGSAKDGAAGYGGSASYGYAQGPFFLGIAARYFSPNYGRLLDSFTFGPERFDGYTSASVSLPVGTFSVGYSVVSNYTQPGSEFWTLGYNVGAFGGKGILSATYTLAQRPTSNQSALLSFTWYFNRDYAAVAQAAGGRGFRAQSVALQKIVPQGEGFGFNAEAGAVEENGGAGVVGRGSLQVNATHVSFGADYSRASIEAATPGFSRAFLAGSVGYVGGNAFAARPVLDSVAVVKVGDVPDVPVYSNGWLVGNTDANGTVIANNLISYYDNYVSFVPKNLPLNYQYPKSLDVLSPSLYSASVVNFELRKSQAVYGRLVREQAGVELPVEFRELRATHAGQTVGSFTARRGEFFLENLEPGSYSLSVEGDPACTTTMTVSATDEPMTDLGTLVCAETKP